MTKKKTNKKSNDLLDNLKESEKIYRENLLKYKDKFLYVFSNGSTAIDEYNIKNIFYSDVIVKLNNGCVLKNRFGKPSRNANKVWQKINDIRHGRI